MTLRRGPVQALSMPKCQRVLVICSPISTVHPVPLWTGCPGPSQPCGFQHGPGGELRFFIPTASLLHSNYNPGLGSHHTPFTPLPPLTPSAQRLPTASSPLRSFPLLALQFPRMFNGRQKIQMLPEVKLVIRIRGTARWKRECPSLGIWRGRWTL